jgi:hypothetical protein
MRASHIMAVAVVLYVIKRWATPGETAVSVQVVAGGLFAIGVIALLDSGKTEPVAKGFAWLFLAVAAYNAVPAIAAAAGKKPAAAKKKGGK